MADIRRSRTISAPPTAVWDVLADFGSLSSWADGVAHSSVLNQGPGGGDVGTIRRVQMGRNAIVERITEFEPGVALAYDIEGLPTKMGDVSNRWTLRSSGNATEVALTSTVEIGASPLSSAAEWVACRVMAKQSDSMLAGLAHRLETAHA